MSWMTENGSLEQIPIIYESLKSGKFPDGDIRYNFWMSLYCFVKYSFSIKEAINMLENKIERKAKRKL